MGELSPWHWAVVIIVLVVLFGARRLPDAARSLGRSARILKSELRADDEPPPDAPPATPVALSRRFHHHKAIRGTIDATSPG
jgi:sec-independent protein translocase protein TatA